MDAKLKRTVALVGHAHCGKTTLAESLLFKTGTISRKGAVMKGSTVSDFQDDEMERKNSINASFLRATYKGHRIQLIDTPGYLDFIGDTVSSLKVTDAAVLVVDATHGVEVGTEDVWERLTKVNIPRIVFINKLDKDGANADEAIAVVQSQLSKNIQKIDLDSADLVEAVAETDDALLEKYLDSGSLSKDEVQGALRKAVLEAKIFPLVLGCAEKDEGIEDLLDTIIADLPAPVERTAFKAKDPESGDDKEMVPHADGPFAGYVFKSVFDTHLGQLSLIRVLQGELGANADIFNLTQNVKEHVGAFSYLQGKDQEKVTHAECGDIIALPKLKNTHVGDTLGNAKGDFVISPIEFPSPSFSASIKPKTRADEDKISSALHRLCEEDHTVQVSRDSETNEMLIAGMGDLHLKVLLDRMKSRYHVDVELGTPKVTYRETITKVGRARYKHKKQSGGRGQYGDVELEIAPLPRDGEEYEFINKIFGGAIPRNYIPSVEKGVKQTIKKGVVANSPIIHVQVSVVDGSYHTVDSSDMAFQIAGAQAMKEAIKEAGPILLEPIMEISVVIPPEFMGPISGDISSRRGKILGTGTKGKNDVVSAHVPMAEIFKYASDLRSMTGGRGNYSMKFAHFEQVPAKIAQKIIEEKTKREEK